MSDDTAPSAGERLDALAEEFLARRRAGERVSVAWYAAAHAEFAAEIADLFPTLERMERAADALRGATKRARR